MNMEFLKENLKKIIGVGVAIAVLIVGLLVYNNYQENKAAKERVDNELNYLNQMEEVIDKMLRSGAKAEAMASGYKNVWYDAIYDELIFIDGEMIPVSDFNEAINLLFNHYVETGDNDKLKDDQVEISVLIDDLSNPPARFERVYDLLLDVYTNYEAYVDLALDPSGSYKSYSEVTSNLSSEMIKQFRELRVRLPKKEDIEADLKIKK